jgi:hypothetical protein
LRPGELQQKYVTGNFTPDDASYRRFLTESYGFYKRVLVDDGTNTFNILESTSWLTLWPTDSNRMLIGVYDKNMNSMSQTFYNLPSYSNDMDTGAYFQTLNWNRAAVIANGNGFAFGKYASLTLIHPTQNYGVSETKMFKLENRDEMFKEFSCEMRKNVVTLVWKNRLGGFEKFYFLIKNQTNAVAKESYQISDLKFNTTTEKYVDNITENNKQVFFNDKVYMNSQLKESYVLISPTLTDAESKWLTSLVESTEVYWETPDAIVPVSITDTTYQVKRKAIDKVFRLELQVEITKNIMN